MIKLYNIILKIPAAMIALTIASFARHLTAYLLGDNTPFYHKKLTLMPTVHLDPVGFLMMLIFGIGWSKTPTINPNNFTRFNYKSNYILFFLSGPFANFIVAVVFYIALNLILNLKSNNTGEIILIINSIILFNLSIASISFVPFPPFSGYYILKELLPYEIRYKISLVERYSLIIMIVLLYTNILRLLIEPIFFILYRLVTLIGGLFF